MCATLQGTALKMSSCPSVPAKCISMQECESSAVNFTFQLDNYKKTCYSFFSASAGDWAQGFLHTRQELYPHPKTLLLNMNYFITKILRKKFMVRNRSKKKSLGRLSYVD